MQIGPVYFAWVDPDETVFGPEHQVWDEQLTSAVVDHEEGEIAKLTAVMRNPGPTGLLNLTTRKRHAWLAYDDGDEVVPMFFGRVNGIPGGISGEKITVVFHAEPGDFVIQKRILARDLRVPPHYDQAFFDVSRRDDPDAVLEGYSKHWHIDRVTHEVTVSDIIVAEDGVEEFEANEVPFASVNCEVGERPVSAVTIDSTIEWNQRHSGVVGLPTVGIASYGGDGFLGDQPKQATSLGGGWFVKESHASEPSGIQSAESVSWSYEWQNKNKRHNNGDTMSVSIQITEPTVTGITETLTLFTQTGVLDPFAVDSEGNPAPINIPMKINSTSMTVPLWNVVSSLVLAYEADRQRSERIIIRMRSDLQPSIIESESEELAEVIEVPGSDVGVPILEIADWADIRGTVVAVGDVIFPEYPQFPGVRIAQVCTTGGLTGTTFPDFSPIEGVTTADGAAVWTSLGETTPTESPEDWTPDTDVPLGDVILPAGNNLIPTYVEAMLPGLSAYPQNGTDIAEGQIVRASNGSYHKCIVSGTTALRSAPRGFDLPNDVGGFPYINLYSGTGEPSFSTTWGVTLVDGSVVWFCLGTSFPTGAAYFISTQAGTTGLHLPPFNPTVGAVTPDGTAEWTCIGHGEIPIGGAPGNTPRAAYFPTPRGLESVEFLVCVGRAFLLNKSRCVSISFQVPFLRALTLSCRKAAHLEHVKIPGGAATGKITKYSIVMTNDGKFHGLVTMMCAIGKGASVTEVVGTPVYCSATYVGSDYQRFEGREILLPGVGDITYVPPVEGVVDDGLTFPLDIGEAVLINTITGSVNAQASSILAAMQNAKKVAELGQIQPQSKEQAISLQQQQAHLNRVSVDRAIKDNAIRREIRLAPVTGGPYEAVYSVDTSNLMVPKHIDLEG